MTEAVTKWKDCSAVTGVTEARFDTEETQGTGGETFEENVGSEDFTRVEDDVAEETTVVVIVGPKENAGGASVFLSTFVAVTTEVPPKIKVSGAEVFGASVDEEVTEEVVTVVSSVSLNVTDVSGFFDVANKSIVEVVVIDEADMGEGKWLMGIVGGELDGGEEAWVAFGVGWVSNVEVWCGGGGRENIMDRRRETSSSKSLTRSIRDLFACLNLQTLLDEWQVDMLK